MQKFKTFLTVIGAVTILVLAANSAVYAATGGKFVLGKTNKANRVSTLKRTTSGSALNLVTKSPANAPMTLNGQGKVDNLNADRLDGLDSTALTTVPYVFTRMITTPTSGFTVDAAVPAGSYLVNYSAAVSGGTVPWLDCFVEQHNGGTTTHVAETIANGNGFVAGSGAGLVTKQAGAGDFVRLNCYANQPFVSWSNLGASAPVQFVLTPVNSVSSSAARIAPAARVVR
jgi:hypothetical protein